MAGEGCAFLHAPPGFGPRPPITGWFAEFEDLSLPPGSVGYAKDAKRFLGATFDPSGLYRFNAVQRMLEQNGLTTARISTHVAGLQQQLLGAIAGTALGKAELLNPLDNGPHARFLAFRSPNAQRWYAELLGRNCVTDVRGDVLRIGFGIYQDEEDVDRLAGLIRGLSVNVIRPARSGTLILSLLLIAYIFNFLDRTILSILGGPIITELKLSDFEFGVLSGPPFAILYSVLGIPFAYLADRTSRSRIIVGALVLWSGFTALVRAAVSFWTLFLFRMGVGIGEAGGVAPSYALIADYFPPQRRARALAIFSLGIPLGLAAGTLIGAYLAAWIDWRAAFLVMGVAGLILAPIMLIFVRDLPARDRRHATDAGPASVSRLSRASRHFG